MISKLQNWLNNPKRKYTDGVAIFMTVATAQQKTNFATFFQSVDNGDKIDQFDIHFTTLVNQLAFSMRQIQSNPKLLEKLAAIKADEPKADKPEGDQTPPPTDQTPPPLPPEFEVHQERLKELIPLMARAHAEMADEKIADDKRAKLRRELVEMDKERRSIWAEIDKYVEDGTAPDVELSEEEIDVVENMIKLGAQTALRIGQLKGYITRGLKTLQEHLDAGKDKLAATAQEKLDKWVVELAELEELLND